MYISGIGIGAEIFFAKTEIFFFFFCSTIFIFFLKFHVFLLPKGQLISKAN